MRTLTLGQSIKAPQKPKKLKCALTYLASPKKPGMKPDSFGFTASGQGPEIIFLNCDPAARGIIKAHAAKQSQAANPLNDVEGGIVIR